MEVSNDEPEQNAATAEKFFNEENYILAFRALQQKKGRSEILSTEDKEMFDVCYQHIREMTLKNTLVFISGGSFIMGDNDGAGDEKPAREVTVNGFEISKYEITNGQFVNFLNAINCNADGSINGNTLINLQENTMIIYDTANEYFDIVNQAERYPATGVTWYGADLFCKFFEGRLQTEAEWEYLASFIQRQDQDIDIDSLKKLAWFSINADQNLHPVGSLEPDNNGIYDLFGNVFEWCYDYYDPDYYKKSENINPIGPPSGYTKVIRGGDINSPVNILTKSFRYNADMNGLSGDNIGFRICFPKNQKAE
jgi:formylglycine-generating enzyme required for sulfatase activity